MNRQWQSPATAVTVTTGTPTVVEVKAPHRGVLQTVSVLAKNQNVTTDPQVRVYTSQAAANVAAATWLLDRAEAPNVTTINNAYATLPAGSPDFYLVTRETLTGDAGRLLTDLLNLPYVNQDGSISFPGMALWFVILYPASGAAAPINLTVGITVETPTFM